MTNNANQAFRTSFKVSRDFVKWYPGHMEKGMKSMQRKIRSVDCILEVHDARISISGRNPNFVKRLLGTKPHILILNKIDLIEKKDRDIILSKLQKDGAHEVIFTNCLKYQSCPGISSLIPKAIDLINNSERYHRSLETDLQLMVIGIPNVGKSTIINVLRHKNLSRGKATSVGKKAGITTNVLNKIKVSTAPDMFLIDTPGILPPNIPDTETAMKLALCSCFKDTIVTAYVIADFLLYWLNKTENFKYVEILNLDEPSDDIQFILGKIATEENKFHVIKDVSTGNLVKIPNVEHCANKLLRQFRTGVFGLINLDKPLLLE